MSELTDYLKELKVLTQMRVRLKHAGESDFYIDIKKAYGDPHALQLICNELWKKIDKRTTCILAGGYGGIPPATVLAIDYDRKLTMAREVPKRHGLHHFIEGYIPTKKDYITIIDDVFTTGKSLQDIIDNIQQTGAKILGAHVVVKRGKGRLSVTLHYLLTPHELL